MFHWGLVELLTNVPIKGKFERFKSGIINCLEDIDGPSNGPPLNSIDEFSFGIVIKTK